MSFLYDLVGVGTLVRTKFRGNCRRQGGVRRYYIFSFLGSDIGGLVLRDPFPIRVITIPESVRRFSCIIYSSCMLQLKRRPARPRELLILYPHYFYTNSTHFSFFFNILFVYFKIKHYLCSRKGFIIFLAVSSRR